MARRTYVGERVDVSFDGDVCTHSAHCVNGLPAVFDTAQKPWIMPDGADAEAVVEQVGRCPSGALRIERYQPPAG